MGGLLEPVTGEVFLDGRSVGPRELRGAASLAFQSPESQIFEENVFEDVAFGPRQMGRSLDEVDTLVSDALELLELDVEDMRTRSPFSLSFGEKRRVALAGVLAMGRRFVILDEPTSGLDQHLCSIVSRTIQRLAESERGVLLISHDTDVICGLSDEITVLQKGRSVYTGSPAGILEREDRLRGAGLSIPTVVRLHAILERINPELCRDVEEELRAVRLY
jgi:energy-coupling factor transport system ATP-binding protein